MIGLTLVSGLLSAQSALETWSEKIELTGEELKKEIKIEVPKGNKEICVSVRGTVSGGHLKVRMYNPAGFRCANLNLNASGNSKAKGRLTECMDAKAGTWVLKVTNDKAKGNIHVKVAEKDEL